MPNLSNRLARWGGSALLVTSMLLSGPAGALAGSAPAAGDQAPVAAPNLGLDPVLWAQDTAGDTNFSITVSSNFEPLFDDYDSQAADDFENTDGSPWQITAIRAYGTYEGGSGSNQVTSLLVQIYADAGGLPGILLTSQTIASGQITGLGTGEFTVNLSPALIVGPGRYWLSVQAYKPDFLSTGRQWEWYEKEALVLSPSVWRQPGNAYGKNCLTFQPRVDVCDQPTNTENYDLVFAIFGNTGANNPVPIATNLNPPARAPGAASFTLQVGGVNFVSNSKVIWGASVLTPTAWSGNLLTVTVPSSYIATFGTAQVKVRNPGPGGGDSNALTFYIASKLYLPLAHRP